MHVFPFYSHPAADLGAEGGVTCHGRKKREAWLEFWFWFNCWLSPVVWILFSFCFFVFFFAPQAVHWSDSSSWPNPGSTTQSKDTWVFKLKSQGSKIIEGSQVGDFVLHKRSDLLEPVGQLHLLSCRILLQWHDNLHKAQEQRFLCAEVSVTMLVQSALPFFFRSTQKHNDSALVF